ncbi:MAG: hypothetical protein ACXAC7_21700, partial [Candidatus Hodarchaeales archaeon]
MILLIPRLLSRNSPKTLGFIRDITIPIILILSVFALISSLNIQITNLVTLGGQDSYLLLRGDDTSSLENSKVPKDILNLLELPNIKDILPTQYFNATMKGFIDEYNIFNTQIIVQAVNLEKLVSFWPRHPFDKNLLENAKNNSAYIG